MYTHNGRTIQAHKAWTSDDGVQHPANWERVWADEDKTRWNVVWSEDKVKKSFDNRFYWGYKVDADGNETDELNPKKLEDLKKLYIRQKKEEANYLLHKSDWYIVRKAETDVAVPDEITAYRKAVRDAYAEIKTRINGVAELSIFIDLFEPSEQADGIKKSEMDCYPDELE